MRRIWLLFLTFLTEPALYFCCYFHQTFLKVWFKSNTTHLGFALLKHIIVSIFGPGGRWRAVLTWLKAKGLVGVHGEPLEGGNLPGRPRSSVWNHIGALHGGRVSAQLVLSFLWDHVQSASSDLIQVHEQNHWWGGRVKTVNNHRMIFPKKSCIKQTIIRSQHNTSYSKLEACPCRICQLNY